MKSYNSLSTPIENGVELRKSKIENIDPTYFISLVGSLWYLTYIGLDILYKVGLISRFMEIPNQSYLNAAKIILHYIKWTINKVMFYISSKTSILLDTQIVIRKEIRIKEKAQHDLSFL